MVLSIHLENTLEVVVLMMLLLVVVILFGRYLLVASIFLMYNKLTPAEKKILWKMGIVFSLKSMGIWHCISVVCVVVVSS